jgi:hypothetical protein
MFNKVPNVLDKDKQIMTFLKNRQNSQAKLNNGMKYILIYLRV